MLRMGQHRKVSGAFLMILGGRIQTALRSVIRTPGAQKTFDPSVAMLVARP
jgi:hypothetical protein